MKPTLSCPFPTCWQGQLFLSRPATEDSTLFYVFDPQCILHINHIINTSMITHILLVSTIYTRPSALPLQPHYARQAPLNAHSLSCLRLHRITPSLTSSTLVHSHCQFSSTRPFSFTVWEGLYIKGRDGRGRG